MIRFPHHGPIANSLLGWLVVVAAWLATAPQTALSQSRGDILRTPERILAEERRQLDAQRRVNALVRRIDWLLEDLESNGFTPETAGGGKYDKARERLVTVGNTHVPRAVTLLRNARSDLGQAYPDLVRADVEIETIVHRLDEVIGDASEVLFLESALRELRHLIKNQEFLKRQTEALVKNKSQEKADFERLGKAQQVLAQPASRLLMLLTDEENQLDQETAQRFAAASKAIRVVPHEMVQGGGRIAAHDLRGVMAQERILASLRKAERILMGQEIELADLLKDLRQLLEDQKRLKKEVEESDDKQLGAARVRFQLRQNEILVGVSDWFVIEQARDGPMKEPLLEARGACGRALHHLAYVPHEEHSPKTIEEMAKVIAALERALAIGEKELAEQAEAIKLSDLEGKGEPQPGEEGDDMEGFAPPIGFEPDEKEPEKKEGEGEEQTAGGKKQRDKGLGDAEKPPKDGEEVDEASGSEGKPGDPGPSEFEGKGGPIGGGDVEEGDDSGVSINPNSRMKRMKISNTEKAEGRSSGGLAEFLFGEGPLAPKDANVPTGGKKKSGRQADDAVARRRRSAAIKEYVKQLPPEFRQQVADYYEALAK